MIILQSKRDRGKLVFLLGQGLIGSAIVQKLKHSNFKKLYESSSNWYNPEKLLLQVSELMDFCDFKKTQKMEVVWSAGKAGFKSSEEETTQEYHVFKLLINYLIDFVTVQHRVALKVHLISSAGGLFEGIRNVGLQTEPQPRRPYGRLKLNQENYLKEKENELAFCIYRLTSVYGFIKKGERFGLISTLIFNLINHKTTYIYGNYSTMRDYLWVEDAARFIVNTISSNTQPSQQIYFVVSAQPATIFEIQKRIEKISKKRCLISFSNESNDAHITFSKKCIPENLKNHALPYVVQSIYKAAINRGWHIEKNDSEMK